MTLKECYERFGGDYEGVISRLRTDERVQKFMIKFLNDTSHQALHTSINEKNYEEAFRAAHTLKGVCQNLGFSRLHDSSDAMTELLRDRQEHNVSGLLEQLDEDYRQLTDAIRAFQEG